MLKSLQIIQKMLELIPAEDILDKNHTQKICNLVNFPDKKIKEEVGNFIILLSDKIDDVSSLLEIQKFNQAKIENQPENEKIQINFVSEPRKSKNQLQKLLEIVEEYIK